MPNQETSVDQYSRSCMENRKPSFIDSLSPSTNPLSRKNSANSQIPPPKLVKEEVRYENRNLQLSECTFSDAKGNQRTTAVIHKRHPSSSRDESVEQSGILSIGILKRHILCDCLILVKKYRPGLRSYVLEFPAKIVENSFSSHRGSSVASSDSDSSVGDIAVRNVEENTGYRSTQIQWVSPETAMEPDLSDHKLKLVSMLIDGDDPIRNNFSCLDNNSNSGSDSDCESDHHCTDACHNEMEVIPVPINGLLDRLDEYDRQGVVIDARVYAFAIGLKKGEKLAQTLGANTQPENIQIAL